jgi:hypothetical protein
MAIFSCAVEITLYLEKNFRKCISTAQYIKVIKITIHLKNYLYYCSSLDYMNRNW